VKTRYDLPCMHDCKSVDLLTPINQIMKIKFVLPLLIALLITNLSFAQRVRYSGRRHTYSHGGHYTGGHGSSHRGGHYRNSRTGNHYGRHK
jgi:hypothetical protein